MVFFLNANIRQLATLDLILNWNSLKETNISSNKSCYSHKPCACIHTIFCYKVVFVEATNQLFSFSHFLKVSWLLSQAWIMESNLGVDLGTEKWRLLCVALFFLFSFLSLTFFFVGYCMWLKSKKEENQRDQNSLKVAQT